jgi:hypothetical protein
MIVSAVSRYIGVERSRLCDRSSDADGKREEVGRFAVKSKGRDWLIYTYIRRLYLSSKER